MNTKITNILTEKVKVFQLVKFNERIQHGRNLYFSIDESSVAFCLGIFIDGLAIQIGGNQIFPIYHSSPDTELDTYYLYNVYDYGEKIPKEQPGEYIVFLEDDEKLTKQYYKTIEWYEEIQNNEEKNIININKIKAIRDSKR